MKTKMQEVLTDKIGFVTQKELDNFEKILEMGDIISETSRKLDSMCGSLTVVYLTVQDLKGGNGDMIAKAYKEFIREVKNLVAEMYKKIEELEKEDLDESLS